MPLKKLKLKFEIDLLNQVIWQQGNFLNFIFELQVLMKDMKNTNKQRTNSKHQRFLQTTKLSHLSRTKAEQVRYFEWFLRYCYNTAKSH